MGSESKVRFGTPPPELSPRLDLFKTVKKIYVKPSTLSPGEALVIDRSTEDIALEYLTNIPTPSTRIPIFGVMGIVRMIPCKYLVVIEEKTRVGPDIGTTKSNFLSNTWRVEKVNMLPVAPGKRRMSSKKARLNDHYELTMLEIFNSKTFYFSYDVDLSHSLKRISQMDSNSRKTTGVLLWVNKMFIWNFPILIPFLKLESAHQYVVPVVNGFVGSSLVRVKNVRVHLSIISRRRRSRSGKRYFCRGINKKGYCANFVESEMIVEIGRTMIGFLMTRGSLPFYWTQWPDMSFVPKPHILYGEANDSAFMKHASELIKEYGALYMIDMVNEHRLPKQYKEFNNFLRLCVEESRHANNITLLKINLFNLNWAKESLHDFEVYSALRNILSTVLIRSVTRQTQKGIFHICSMDGTDMTDIMQFSLAKIALLEVLLYAEYSGLGTQVTKDPKLLYDELLPELSRLWLENSNSLAIYYVGTKSLRAEFYSTNILKKMLSLKDRRIQFQRWMINNFKDGDANDCIQVLTTDSSVETIPDDSVSGYQRIVIQHLTKFTRNVILPFSVAYAFSHFILLARNGSPSLCLLQWVLAVFYSTYLLLKNLTNFVNIPKLTPKPSITRRPSDWYFN
ncbi:hypothetical protein GE061_014528 [Apolygus lucorum]|uniref:Phosphatidylinositol-3-phosphatase SAC1 n=1 Tax=Apolygus lucorum TaxID=248454 RepID=A0A8S9XKK6_APOLU|nr:hypothetical protein GE061_014528 [Apolygus lucorum]